MVAGKPTRMTVIGQKGGAGLHAAARQEGGAGLQACIKAAALILSFSPLGTSAAEAARFVAFIAALKRCSTRNLECPSKYQTGPPPKATIKVSKSNLRDRDET